MQNKKPEQEIIHLSKEKWRWMSERDAEPLEALFHEKSVFVHMGGACGKAREMEIIQKRRNSLQKSQYPFPLPRSTRKAWPRSSCAGWYKGA